MQLKRSEGFGQGTRRVCMAEWLALPTLDHEVLKLNPTGGIFQLMTAPRFIA